MPSADIVIDCPVKRSVRVKQVEGMFDLSESKTSRCEWSVRMPIEEREWNIGLIAGPSGSGKTQILNRMFGGEDSYKFNPNHSVLDAFPGSVSIKDISELLSSIGFSSPPSWLRSFNDLSNGEQFRVKIARALCSGKDPILIDEFTSVVDRNVAKIGSAAVSKIVRRKKLKLIAASCHYDIIDWLQPDWIYQPATGDFQWRELQRRPAIKIEIHECTAQAWRIFRKHHYLNTQLNKSAMCFVAFWQSNPVCFTSWMYSSRVNKKVCIREHRTVVLPDFQGVGIGNSISEKIASKFVDDGYDVFSTTSHPAMIRHRNKSGLWQMIRKPSISNKAGATARIKRHSDKRLTASFKFIGNNALAPSMPSLKMPEIREAQKSASG